MKTGLAVVPLAGITHGKRPSLFLGLYSASGDVACWYCHVWKRGGSLFDFLRYYYALEPRLLWHRILSGEQF